MSLPSYLHPFAVLARRRIKQLSAGRVISGPFAGMVCSPTWSPSKVLGIYEREIYSALAEFRKWPGATLINVGAADGYYTVGLLYAKLAEKVIAFESMVDPREAIISTVKSNKMEMNRIDLRGLCTIQLLADAITSTTHPVLLVDVEGYEDELLEPTRIPALKSVPILVEVHDNYAPGVSDRIISRFSGSHRVNAIPSLARTRADLPLRDFIIKSIPDRHILALIDEARSRATTECQWLWLTPDK